MTHSNLSGTIAQRRPAEQTALALLAIFALLFSMMAILAAQPASAATIPAVLALSEDCAQTALHKQIDWSGNDTDVIGDMHSNAGITVSGARNDVSGSVTFDDTNCNFVLSGSNNTGDILSPSNSGSRADPGYAVPTEEDCDFVWTGSDDVDLKNEDVWLDSDTLMTGLYCHLGTGKLQQSAQGRDGTVSFFANGHIDLSNGSNATYSPFRLDGVLTHSLANSVDAVTLAGSGTDNSNRTHYNGIIYAPNGEAETGGQWINIGCLIAETVKLNGNDHIIGFNCGSETPPPDPTIALTKTNNTTGPVAPNTPVNFTITVDVLDGPAAGSIIKDVLPPGYDAPTAISDDGEYTPGTRTIEWGPLSVAHGDTFTYTAVVSASTANGAVLVNTATITSPETNCPPEQQAPAGLDVDDPCEDDSTVTVVVVPPAPAVSISKSNNTTGPVAPGTAVNYTLVLDVINGPVPAMTVVDQLPAAISNAITVSDGGTYDAGTNRITWNLVNVADNETLTYTATVSASAPAGTHTNTATITAGPCTVGCNDTSDVVVVVAGPTPTVTITKTNNATGPVATGTAVNFTLTFDVTNGPVPAMTVVDQLPAGIGNATAISNGGSYNAGTNRITWTLTNVADNATLTYTATVSATAGTHTNTATITVGPCVGAGCVDTSTVTVPGGGALGGNPAPTPPTVPNTATGLEIGGAPVTMPIVLVVLLLVGSLSAFAMANVRSRRRRQL